MESKLELKLESWNILGKTVSVMPDGFICITETMAILAKKRKSMGLKKRELNDVLATGEFRGRLKSLLNQIGYGIDPMKSKIDYSNPTLKELRKVGLAYRKGSRTNQRWFIDPYVFVAIAMDLDPEIYGTVVSWIQNGLVINRNTIGDHHIKLASCVSNMTGKPDKLNGYMSRIEMGINYVVFGNHHSNIRDKASSTQLYEVSEIQSYICESIEEGHMKTFNDIIGYLGRKWRNKQTNPVLTLTER